MLSQKYFKFYVNSEEFIFETQELNKYAYFKKIMSDNNFKKENININFNIELKLINVAHNINNLKKFELNIQQITQIYYYLDYLIPDHFDNQKLNLASFYEPNYKNNYDLKIILDPDIFDVFIRKKLFKIYLDNYELDIPIRYYEVDKIKECKKLITKYLENFNIFINSIDISCHVQDCGKYTMTDGILYLNINGIEISECKNKTILNINLNKFIFKYIFQE